MASTKRKGNWVTRTGPGGHLPDPIHTMWRHICEKNPSWDDSHCIAVAVAAAKKGCATGDVNWPGLQHMNKASLARYCRGVDAWEAMKAKAHGNK